MSIMVVRNANVMARVDPDIKERAEQIMAQLGLPVSVVINALYRQIIMNNAIPFSIAISTNIPSRDKMTDEEFNEMMAKELAEAKTDYGKPLDEAFDIWEDWNS